MINHDDQLKYLKMIHFFTLDLWEHQLALVIFGFKWKELYTKATLKVKSKWDETFFFCKRLKFEIGERKKSAKNDIGYIEILTAACKR